MRENTAVVGDLAIDAVACVPADTSLRNACRVLHGTGKGIVLLESTALLAVTDRDIVRALAQGRSPDTPASEVAGDTLLAVHPSTPLSIALHRMIDAEVRSLVVVDSEHHVVGLVTIATVLEGLLGPLPWLGALRLALHIEGRPT